VVIPSAPIFHRLPTKPLNPPVISLFTFSPFYHWCLAKKPGACLEYIIAHERVHFLERNHHDRFVSILEKHLPHWRQNRQELHSAPLAHETWSY